MRAGTRLAAANRLKSAAYFCADHENILHHGVAAAAAAATNHHNHVPSSSKQKYARVYIRFIIVMQITSTSLECCVCVRVRGAVAGVVIAHLMASNAREWDAATSSSSIRVAPLVCARALAM